MKIIRWILGRVILLADAVTAPTAVKRSAAEQKKIDELTQPMSLYQFQACPFCVKVRRQLKRHGLKIELRDAKNNQSIKAELAREGGRHKVPCLRTDNPDGSSTWLYESNDIIAHLNERLGLSA
ncbi:glutaredoxin [Porticoccaceae bacterium]|nr:glutaredoxin [Porticoccaceae bacterium]MDA8651306.1 glutaredoxin [Porticoccaceae bacterium]MDA8682553.1 glutaredoxin [Porticoccaceae bacterium]MDA8788907.1 glutaredoxin [Porticoccaceae bacterium]MDB2635135.1 glutaredoxin [Porticoccaceae bacterium]